MLFIDVEPSLQYFFVLESLYKLIVVIDASEIRR